MFNQKKFLPITTVEFNSLLQDAFEVEDGSTCLFTDGNYQCITDLYSNGLVDTGDSFLKKQNGKWIPTTYAEAMEVFFEKFKPIKPIDKLRHQAMKYAFTAERMISCSNIIDDPIPPMTVFPENYSQMSQVVLSQLKLCSRGLEHYLVDSDVDKLKNESRHALGNYQKTFSALFPTLNSATNGSEGLFLLSLANRSGLNQIDSEQIPLPESNENLKKNAQTWLRKINKEIITRSKQDMDFKNLVTLHLADLALDLDHDWNQAVQVLSQLSHNGSIDLSLFKSMPVDIKDCLETKDISKAESLLRQIFKNLETVIRMIERKTLPPNFQVILSELLQKLASPIPAVMEHLEDLWKQEGQEKNPGHRDLIEKMEKYNEIWTIYCRAYILNGKPMCTS